MRPARWYVRIAISAFVVGAVFAAVTHNIVWVIFFVLSAINFGAGFLWLRDWRPGRHTRPDRIEPLDPDNPDDWPQE